MREREEGERIALWAGDHDRSRMRSSHGNGLNLDQRTRPPQAPTDRGAGRVGRCEEGPVDLVIGSVMTPIGQHHCGLDHIVQAKTGQRENCLKSGEDVPGLGPNVAWTYQRPWASILAWPPINMRSPTRTPCGRATCGVSFSEWITSGWCSWLACPTCVKAESMVSRGVARAAIDSISMRSPSRPRPPWKVELVGKGACT